MVPGPIFLLPIAVAIAMPLQAGAPGHTAPGLRSHPESFLRQQFEPDSAEVAGRLRSHQRRFERTRRDHLPWIWPSSSRCDERIGRFCFTFDEDDEAADPERFDDPPEVQAARDGLIAALWSGVRAFPDHRWIVGQLVRYLVEADRADEAGRAALQCRVPRPNHWWCDALAGFSQHAAGRFVAAGSAFDRALAKMPPHLRCEWTDLSDLLEGDIRGAYQDLDCTERGPLQRRIWWLSDPFLSQPGNAVRTEHFARLVWSGMQEDAYSPEPSRWGDDLREVTVRYGRPEGWERIREGRTHVGPPNVTTHYGYGARTFVPASEALEDPFTIAADDWILDPDQPRSQHAVAFAREAVEPLDATVALFRRGDSTVLIVTYQSTDDSLSDTARVDAYLVASRDDTAPSHIRHRVGRGRRGSLSLVVPATPHVVAVEVLVPEAGRAGWARFGLDPGPLKRGAVTASQFLAVDAADSLPATLTSAIAMARLPGPYHPGERVGLYWEVYGLPTRASLAVGADLSLGKEGKSIFRRIAELTPFASDDPPVHMSWTDIKPAGDAVLRRSIAVDLPRDLSSGDYHVRLVLDLDGTHIATLELPIRVEDAR